MKTTLLLILMACSLSANAVEFRERNDIVPGNNPTGCNTIYHVVEKFDSGFWIVESVTITYNSCNGGGGWVE